MGTFISQSDFIAAVTATHHNKYSYANTIYRGAVKPILIGCPIHGEFSQTANDHKRGQGCPRCARASQSRSVSRTPDQFLRSAIAVHGDLYSYALVKSFRSTDKIEIVCKAHGSFVQSLANHLSGSGCGKCAGNRASKTVSEHAPHLVPQWHPTRNLHIKPSDILPFRTKVWWLCDKGHEWSTRIAARLNGSSCPYCPSSKGETKIVEVLTALQLPYRRQVRFDDCRCAIPLPFDFAVDNDRLSLIEYQGQQHYHDVPFGGSSKISAADINRRDRIKSKYCESHNIPLLVIPYWNFNRIEQTVTEFFNTH